MTTEEATDMLLHRRWHPTFNPYGIGWQLRAEPSTDTSEAIEIGSFGDPVHAHHTAALHNGWVNGVLHGLRLKASYRLAVAAGYIAALIFVLLGILKWEDKTVMIMCGIGAIITGALLLIAVIKRRDGE